MGKHLVLAGGGHAHLTTLRRLSDIVAAGHSVTLIAPGEYHYYSGMGPGALGGFYRPEDIRFNVRRMAEKRGAAFVRDKVAGIDPDKRALTLASGRTLSYDVVSFNIGSRIPVEKMGMEAGSEGRIFPVKPIENLLVAAEHMRSSAAAGQSPRVLVAGGGPAGFEMAGNAHRFLSTLGVDAPNITLVAGRGLLHGFPRRVRRLAQKSLSGRGVEIIPGRVVRTSPTMAVLDSGHEISFDAAFACLGVAPPDIFERCGLPTGGGGWLSVNSFLQSVEHPEIFGGGDCVHFAPSPLDKVGVYPVRENPILMANLKAALDGTKLTPFAGTKGDYVQILNNGDGRGIFRKGRLIFNGRLAFKLKNYIDTKFMLGFQECGERRGG
jgi:NADH dehydrogenase FAD-containing subunit